MMIYLNCVNICWWCRKGKIIFGVIYICLWIIFVMIIDICFGFKFMDDIIYIYVYKYSNLYKVDKIF